MSIKEIALMSNKNTAPGTAGLTDLFYQSIPILYNLFLKIEAVGIFP